MPKDFGVWVYAIARGAGAPGLAGLTGVGGGPVRQIEKSGLYATVSSVDLDEFGEQPLRRNLENLAWLEATARAHNSVIDAVARHGPTVPIRLATAYLDDNQVRALLGDRRDDFDAALYHITGRSEWGVKAFADPVTMADADADADADAPAEPGGTARPHRGAPGTGAAYLRQRRAQLTAREAAQSTAATYASDVHHALAALVPASRRYASQDPRLTRDPWWMVLNGTYLVDNEQVDTFTGAVNGLAQQYHGLRLELTGPWAPYSFASIEQESDHDGRKQS